MTKTSTFKLFVQEKVEKGEITETGTHRELLERGGRYAYLWNSQTAPVTPDQIAAE